MRVGGLVIVLLGLLAPAAHAGLPSVSSGPRPGPDALYLPPPRAPQLENTGPWRAPAILVAGASAYRDGEFLYQDHLHDDRGAAGVRDPSDPHSQTDFLFSPKTGTLTYPTDPVFAHNAADLVELRVKPLPGATAFRVTLNTLKDPERSAFTIALGDGEARAWPHGAGVRSPAELFLTVHGTTAELRDAATGAVRTPAPAVAVDLERRQFDVRVPHAAWSPGTATVRMAAGTGLWDTAAGTYLRPGSEATAERPGGAAPTGSALFNVAFRFDEPMPDVRKLGGGATIADAAAGAQVDGTWWREKAQAEALLAGDVSRFAAEVDFAKLAARVDDDGNVPKTGPMDRIFASRYVFGQGVDYTQVCFDIAAGAEQAPECKGRFLGQLQTYALYVPAKPVPARGFGLTLLLHSLSANHNQYLASRNQSQLGERGAGSLVATPATRGPDGFYFDVAEADAFEVWADVARHHRVDPEWAAVSGYSMGGFGTFSMLARWPDLFGRGASIVGAAGRYDEQLPSLRNTPIMTWAAAADELVNLADTEETTRRLTEERLRFVHDLFPAADHLTLATSDEYGPVADFLGEHRADRDPPHVTYVVDTTEDHARADVVADHAYWVSGLRVRQGERGTIDVRSEGFGVADAPPLDVQRSAGAVQGGSRGPMPYVRRSRDWGPAPAAPRRDRLVVRATNLAAATIDARRARVSCTPEVELTSDGPFDLRIACAPARPRCRGTVTVRLPRVKGARIRSVVVTRKGRTLARARGRDLRRVTVRRPTRRAFALRVRATTARKGRTVTVVKRFAACR